MSDAANPTASHADKEPIAESEDLPQAITESLGTGVQAEPGWNIGDHRLRDRVKENPATGPELTGGDVDAFWQQADVVGDEAVGGTVPTPDQSIVEELGVAVGLVMDDDEPLHADDILNARDSDRWEFDPESSEDFPDRVEERPDM